MCVEFPDIFFLIFFQRNKCFCLCLLGPNEEVVKFQKFIYFIPFNGEVARMSLQKKSQKVLMTVVFYFSFIYLAMLCLIFELKQTKKKKKKIKK